jgi:hypothetical protein
MSIASASLVPTLAVNGIQFLNPALASVNLATDADGNVVGSAGSDRGVIPANTIFARDGSTALDTSNSYYVIDSVNRLVYLFLGIPNVSDFPTGDPINNLLYINTTGSTPATVIPPINPNVVNESDIISPISTMAYNTTTTLPTFFGVIINPDVNRIIVEVGAQWNQTLAVSGGGGGTVLPIPVPSGASNIIGTIIYPY